MNNYGYEETTHQKTGDLMWKCAYNPESILLTKKFIERNYREGYTLSIYDTTTNNALEITNPIEEIIDKVLSIIGLIASNEHTFVDFIRINSLTHKYIVGMRFTRGKIDIPSSYKNENDKLVPVFKGQTMPLKEGDKVVDKIIKTIELNDFYEKTLEITMHNAKLFRATVVKYVDDKAVATATGTFEEVVEQLNITETRANTYYKLARFNDIPYDYVEDVHFGCLCKKISGLKITEGIYCNAYLNYLFKIYLKGETSMGTFRHLLYFRSRFQEATQIAKNSENFEEWTQQFFETTTWQKVADLNDFKGTSGLYALILDEYAKCYIGQSENIRKRIPEHWRNDRFVTNGIDLFRAKDTTRIYVIPLSEKELDQNEYNYVGAIPSEYRLNYLQGGTIAFHEAQNTSPLFDDEAKNTRHQDDGLKVLLRKWEEREAKTEKSTDLFVEKTLK